jgi:two-component system, OmpR family, response regulator MprA
MADHRILVVDDEPNVRESLQIALGVAGYNVEVAPGGAEALDRASADPPDLMVLDVLMPGVDGLEVCRKLRANGSDLPVLMLTARDEVPDRVAGLEAGADDYLVKPFALEELLARIRSLLRRAKPAEGSAALQFADVTLDYDSYQITRGERRLDLTRTEFLLLELFMRNPRRVLPKRTIFEAVWGYDFGLASNSLEVYVGYLRKKLEENGEPRLIHTVRGVGYVLREEP